MSITDPAIIDADECGPCSTVRPAVELLDHLIVADFGQHVADLFVVDAEIGGDDARIVLHMGRIAVGDLAAVFEHDDMVGNLHDHRHVVLDQQDRCAGRVLDVVQQRVERRPIPAG